MTVRSIRPEGPLCNSPDRSESRGQYHARERMGRSLIPPAHEGGADLTVMAIS